MNDISMSPTKEHRKCLVEHACTQTRENDLVRQYKEILLQIAERDDDLELDDYLLEQFLGGLLLSKVTLIKKGIDEAKLNRDDVVAVCALHNSELLVDNYINHHKKLGISHFVFIDNNSTDDSVDRILDHENMVSIDIWSTEDRFDGFKAMGWKQRMFAKYGCDRWYLNLDIDELFVYESVESNNIHTLTKKLESDGCEAVGAILIDMYTHGPILSDKSVDIVEIYREYRYFDFDTYQIEKNDRFQRRIFGGPRTRLFDRHPSLQKFPLAFVGKNNIALNPHFWYPYNINNRALFISALLHYKFLPGDLERYEQYVRSGVHWDGSSQYRSYVDKLRDDKEASFYSERHSRRFVNSQSLRCIINQDGERLVSSYFES